MESFGFSNNIPTGSGQYLEINNPNCSSIGFHINPPNNGWVQFKGSFDGVNYSDITFRQIGDDGYAQETNEVADYIGSINGLRSIRFSNYTGSNTTGTVVGTFSTTVSTLEGIENGPAPHKFGNLLFHKGINVSGLAFNNSGIYFPQDRHKFAVTNINMGISSQQGAYITFHEGSGTQDDANHWVFSTYIKASTTDTQLITLNLSTPFVSNNFNSGLFLTVTGPTTIRGVLHGYQVN